MRRPLAMLIAVGVCAAASGCRSNNRDLVESQLRARETEARDLREELTRCDSYNKALQLELRSIRGEPFCPGAPDGPTMVYPVRSLTLGRQTGGRELDGCSGDGALQVVLEPRDAENQTVKVPAAALIQALAITPEGTKQPLSTWEIPPEQLRNQWRSGLLTTGYVLVLPWKEPPATEKLRVVAALRLADGRVFEADKDITIRLPGGARKRGAMPPAPEPVPPDGPILPPPRRIDPLPPEARRDQPSSTTTSLRMTARKPWWEVPTPKSIEPGATFGHPRPLP